jgi:hypothetical protein
MLRIQVLCRSTGREDHPPMKVPVLPKWAIEAIRA